MVAVEVRDRRSSPLDPIGRMESLVDPSSLRLTSPPGLRVCTGLGQVGRTPVTLFATDPRESGGALSAAGSNAVALAIDRAARDGRPVVGIWHSRGACLQDGVASLAGIGRVFQAIVGASGRVLQMSLVLGPVAGGAAHGPALADVVILGPQGRLLVTGPTVIRQVTGEVDDALTWGGPDRHATTSATAHVVGRTDHDALQTGRRLLTLLGDLRRPSDWTQVRPDPRMRQVLPPSSRRAYDVRPLVGLLLDEDARPVELQPCWARSLVTVVGRLAGATVGVVASNPLRRGGCLDATSSEKAARFVRTCNALGVPLVVLTDVPGYLPGTAQEWDGVVRRGAKLLHAFADAVVPRVTVITRKAYGGAFIAMNSKALGATTVLAWPTAELGVMHTAAAISIVHRRVLAASPPEQRAELADRLAREYDQSVGGLSTAVKLGLVDRVIDPAETRRQVIRALASAPYARGSHSNIWL